MNSDEGFYAAATRAVAEGEVTYRDFGFTQPPLVTYVNAPMLHLVGFGLFQQRAVNGLWGLLAVLLGARLVARRAGPGWAILTVALFALCPAWMHFINLGKTYGLTSLLVMLGTTVFLDGKPGWRRTVALSFLSILGVGCRLPAAPFFAVLWIASLWDGTRPTLRSLVAAFTSTAVFTAALLLPFYLSAPEQAKFWLFEFHRVSVPLKDWRLGWHDLIPLASAIWILTGGAVAVAFVARGWKSCECVVAVPQALCSRQTCCPAACMMNTAFPFSPLSQSLRFS
jgi:4-amino-4-deoxy-L-arabinose transferase-like glycosyltransferase